MVDRLFIGKKVELEGISFFDNKVFLGFATRKIDKFNAYTFYSIIYQLFEQDIRLIAKNNILLFLIINFITQN